MAKRIFLFVATNLLVILTLSVVLRVLGIQPYLTRQGIDYPSLAAFCLVWGMGGALISLGLSRIVAKTAMGVRVIDPATADPGAQQLLQTVGNLARGAGIPMPQVGIYEGEEINAFATGPTRNRSLVAVSTGLLRKLDSAEVEGVLGHEITHIANGDMVTMTLLQGVVNAFVMFLARVIAFAVAQAMRRDEGENMSYGLYFVVQFALEIVFMILGSLVVMAFSRHREFRADAGGARLAGREKMVGALEALRRDVENLDPRAQPAVASMKISGRGGLFGRLGASHPPLEERIARLRAATA
ncbi:MAG TPA: protease HtpX [Deltaproteobacteria bacterium]|jgi:heat shock protein HtpX|nr:protease HtpX [Deltaproteobacteria bacterium]